MHFAFCVLLYCTRYRGNGRRQFALRLYFLGSYVQRLGTSPCLCVGGAIIFFGSYTGDDDAAVVVSAAAGTALAAVVSCPTSAPAPVDPAPVDPAPVAIPVAAARSVVEVVIMGNISPRSDSRGMAGASRCGISAWTHRRCSQQQKKPYTCRMSYKSFFYKWVEN